MRTLILATAATLALGAGVANASDGGPAANSFFTSLPGVVAQAPMAVQPPGAVAQNRAPAAPTAAFISNSRTGTWLFPPTPNEGANS